MPNRRSKPGVRSTTTPAQTSWRGAFEQRRRRAQRRAARPALGDARVAGVGHRAGAEVGADDERVGVEPGDVRLRFGQHEAAVHEGLVDGVELAHHLGVGAAARQRDQAAAILGAEALGTAPDPVLALGGGQRVEVEHGFPARLRLAVLGERRAPPQAALVLLVLPEVVQARRRCVRRRGCGPSRSAPRAGARGSARTRAAPRARHATRRCARAPRRAPSRPTRPRARGTGRRHRREWAGASAAWHARR